MKCWFLAITKGKKSGLAGPDHWLLAVKSQEQGAFMSEFILCAVFDLLELVGVACFVAAVVAWLM